MHVFQRPAELAAAVLAAAALVAALLVAAVLVAALLALLAAVVNTVASSCGSADMESGERERKSDTVPLFRAAARCVSQPFLGWPCPPQKGALREW